MFESSQAVLPQPAVGVLVFRQGRVLLVKRRNPPHAGKWALPGGGIKLGESLQTAAEREVFEETGLIVKAGDSVHTFDLIERDAEERIRFHYVIVDLAAEFISGTPRPDDDALEAGWFDPEKLQDLDLTEATRKLLRRFGF